MSAEAQKRVDQRKRAAFALCAGPLVLTLAAQTAPADMFGTGIAWPPRPPLINLLGLGGLGRMAYDSATPPKGPVKRVVLEEYRIDPGGPLRPPMLSSTLTTEFDELGREVGRLEVEGISETRTVTGYRDGHIHVRDGTFKRDGKANAPDFWERWTHDEAGRVIDYRCGRGSDLENHFANVKYDRESRLTSFEYRQDPKDELQSRTEYTYEDDGRTIREVEYDEKGERLRTWTMGLDQGRVIRVDFAERDWKSKEWKTPQRVGFRYDAKGRLVEQDAETDKLEGPGVEHAIPPGKVAISYDDTNQTRQSRYSDGSEQMNSVARLDETGAILAWGMSTGESGDATFQMVVDGTYDSRGNWTECTRWQTTGAVRKMMGLWRRTINYRQD